MNFQKLIIGIYSCLLLVGCNKINDAKMFSKIDQTIDKLIVSDLEKLQLQGHMSSALRLSWQDCSGSGNNDRCNKTLLDFANRGHPRAMSHIASRMTFKELGYYDLHKSYMWRLIQQYFIQPIELSNNDYIRSYQKLGENMNSKSIEYLETVLSDQEITSAKAEANKRAKELWQKLQEYCKDWKDEDYVCWYSFDETPM